MSVAPDKEQGKSGPVDRNASAAVQPRPTCTALTVAGRPCRIAAVEGGALCGIHGQSKEARTAAAKLGSLVLTRAATQTALAAAEVKAADLAPTLTSLDAVVTHLENVSALLLSRQIAPSTANAAAALAAHAIRVAELKAESALLERELAASRLLHPPQARRV